MENEVWLVDLREKVRQLPDNPGVYIMKDAHDNIIYIGKAKNLKNRVRQYFRSSSGHSPKILRMIEGIRDFEYILTDTEFDALLLECSMIKDQKPMYNSMLKNHQKYVFININTEELYPTLEVVAEKQSKGLNFGPYNSLSSAVNGLNVIKENIKIRRCRSLSKKNAGCLNYQLGFCLAPCTGELSAIEYRKLIDQAINILKGRKSDLVNQLSSKMKAAAEVLDFDKAVKYRDDIRALKHLMNKGKTIKFTGGNRCIIALERIEKQEYKVFLINGSKIIYKERQLFSGDAEQLQQHLISIILTNAKQLQKHETGSIDKQDIDQAQIIYSYLKNKKECSYMVVPRSWLNKKGLYKLEIGMKRLVDML
jgi:excinuclease ABC subunit C